MAFLEEKHRKGLPRDPTPASLLYPFASATVAIGDTASVQAAIFLESSAPFADEHLARELLNIANGLV